VRTAVLAHGNEAHPLSARLQRTTNDWEHATTTMTLIMSSKHPDDRRARQARRWRQSGSVTITVAIAFSTLLILLIGTELGYLFYEKRELQKAVDLAALAAAQAVDPTSCDGARDAAKANANGSGEGDPLRNLPKGFTLSDEHIVCGHWDAEYPEDRHFHPGETNFNAVQVSITAAPPSLLPFFPGTRYIQAEAVAVVDEPRASFSAGSGVARLNDGALNQLLSMLLGTSVNLSLVDYQGIANANVNLLGMLNALGASVGTTSDLADVNVDLRALLNAAVSALPSSNDEHTADVAVAAIGKLLSLPIALDIDHIAINLLKTAGQSGLLSVDLDTTDPRSALNGNVSLLNILTTALQIANQDAALSLPASVNLAPLATVDAKVRVIEPPSIAIGPPGYNADGTPRTVAHTAPVRVSLKVTALTPVNSGENLLDLNLLLVRVRLGTPAGPPQLIELPIYAEVAPGEAVLEDMVCYKSDGKHEVTLGVTPGVAHVVLGKIDDMAFDNTNIAWSTLVSAKEKFNLLNLRLRADALLGIIPVADVTVALKARLELSIPGDDEITKKLVSFDFDPNTPRAEQPGLVATVGTERHLGAAIGSAINDHLLEVEVDTGVALLGINLDFLTDIVDGLLNNTIRILNAVLDLVGSSILTPVLGWLDGVLGPLLSALGLQLGYTDVQLMSADCDNAARLVY
jgi:uncharacterized membrane protein